MIDGVVRQPVDADPLVGRPALAVTGQSQPRQLPSVHHFVHALGFLALRVKTARALECLTGIGLNTRLALHIRWRRGFALRFFTDQAGSGMARGLVTGGRRGRTRCRPGTGVLGREFLRHVHYFLAARSCARAAHP